MVGAMVVDLQQRRQDEARLLGKMKFVEFIRIGSGKAVSDIILPLFLYKQQRVIVTPPEYAMKVCRFVDERNKPGSPASEVNCLIRYNYLVKHWR